MEKKKKEKGAFWAGCKSCLGAIGSWMASTWAKMKAKLPSFWVNRKSRLGAIILLAVTFSAMLLIVAPFEIYCNNLAELEFSASDFLGWQTVFAVILAAIIFITHAQD